MGIMTYIKIGALIVLLAALYGAKSYYDWSQEEIAILNANAVKMELALKQSEEAVTSLRTGIVESQKVHHAVSQKFAKSRKENTRLKDLLGKHDLGFLAAKKPGLIETRVNKGTKNSNRCFEIMSGSPLTRAEREATKPSQINSSCPEIANPNFKVIR